VMRAPEWERAIGLEYYITDAPGVGGRIREVPEDFIVEEEGELGRARVLLLAGKKAPRTPEGEGNVLWMVMEKRDWDTMDVIYMLSRALGISRKHISFAGTKDKRALTAQWISIANVRWKDIESIRVRDVAFHTPIYRRKRIRLGDLRGNWFRVRVRGAKGPLFLPDVFPNYFGHQRFGSYRFVTHIVGKYLVLGDFCSAVWAYLTKTSLYEPEETRKARDRLAEEQDPKEALEYFPKRLRMEKRLLRALASGKDCKGALLGLHRRTISLFIHAYQAYLFNRILSRRLEHGVEPVEGDVLLDGVPTALVPGFRAEPAGGLQGEIEREILE
jgi:tRNA pseudouridine13 synthase